MKTMIIIIKSICKKIISSNMKSFTVSPLSVALVLMMAACGAAGENAKEMKSVLNFDYNNSVHRTGIYSMIEMFNVSFLINQVEII